MILNWTYATKAIVSLLGSAEVYLMTPNMTWKEAGALLITSVLVWLVPNTNSPAPTLVPVVSPAVPNPAIPMPAMSSERQELESLRTAQKDS